MASSYLLIRIKVSSTRKGWWFSEFHSAASTMRAVLLVLAGLLALAASEKRVVCYFGSWAVYRHGNGEIKISDIDPTLCTHLIYTFVGITEEGDISILDPNADLPDGGGKNGYALFNQLRELSPGTKTMIAIGGWNEGLTPKYSHVAANPTVRRRFVDNVVTFVKKYGFDGFDVDWEYPNKEGGAPADRENFVSLLRELREKFDPEGLELSAAVGAAENLASLSYIIPEVAKSLDFINLMTYDLHGSWETQTGIVAPLYPGSQDSNRKLNVEAVVNYWLAQGAPADKLVLGVPMYGNGFTLANPSNNGIGAPAVAKSRKGPYTGQEGMLGYNEICEKIRNENWNVVYDEEQQVPYAYGGDQWVGFDNERSIKEKADLAKRMGLGGMMVWSLETDDFKGVCGGEKYPLLKTINREFRDGAAIPAPPQSEPTRPSTSSPKEKLVYAQSQTEPPAPAPAPPASSSGDLCSAEGYVRDPQDCNVYYYCQYFNGQYTPLKFNCAPTLFYDQSTGVCDYDYNVSC